MVGAENDEAQGFSLVCTGNLAKAYTSGGNSPKMTIPYKDEMLEKLPLFIDMTIIEFVIDEFECCAREGGEPDEEDIGNAVRCLVNDIPYGGFGEEW